MLLQSNIVGSKTYSLHSILSPISPIQYDNTTQNISLVFCVFFFRKEKEGKVKSSKDVRSQTTFNCFVISCRSGLFSYSLCTSLFRLEFWREHLTSCLSLPFGPCYEQKNNFNFKSYSIPQKFSFCQFNLSVMSIIV